jgi:hypothetical protein
VSLLRGRRQRQDPKNAKMRVGWQQRLMNANVPKRARSHIGSLEAGVGSQPDLLSPFADEVELFDDGTAMLTFGLFHTLEHSLLGIAIVVGKGGIVLVDTSDMSLYAEFQWANLCRFDVKHDHDYQVVGIAWYEGDRPISERLKEGTELQLSDMRFAYLYTHFDKESLSAIQRAFDGSAIPIEVHQRTPLL